MTRINLPEDTSTVFAPGFTRKDNLMLGLVAVPPAVVSLFVAGMKPQAPQAVAMAGLMLSATAYLFLTEVANRFSDRRQANVTISAAIMAVAMVFMAQGAIANADESAITKDVFYSVMAFCVFAAINLIYSALKLAKIIKHDMPLVEFISNILGFAGSAGFLRAKIMSYINDGKLHDTAGQDTAGLVSGTATGFMVVTSVHAVLAAQKMQLGTKIVDTALPAVAAGRAAGNYVANSTPVAYTMWAAQAVRDRLCGRSAHNAEETTHLNAH